MANLHNGLIAFQQLLGLRYTNGNKVLIGCYTVSSPEHSDKMKFRETRCSCQPIDTYIFSKVLIHIIFCLCYLFVKVFRVEMFPPDPEQLLLIVSHRGSISS